MLFYAVGDCVFDKLIKWLDLLVYHTILIKKCINDLPLIIDIYLVLSILIDIKHIHILL
jgi:hypothetical protein